MNWNDLTGNESPADLLALITESIAIVAEDDGAPIETTSHLERRHSPWATLALPNGAEFQLSIVRSGWPEDGTSAQYDDVADGE